MFRSTPLIVVALAALAGDPIAQNLVPNPGFEELSDCPSVPTQGGQTQLAAAPWFTGSGGADVWGCDFEQLPLTPGFPHSGLAAAAAVVSSGDPDAREYLETKLLSPLAAGATYRVGYSVLSASGAVDELGARLTVGPTELSDVAQPLYGADVISPDGFYFDDGEQWMSFSADYVAAGGERYLTIGNFGTAPPGFAHYFFDDVYVIRVPELNGCTPAPPGMISWWTLDDAGAGLARDFAGGHDGIFVGDSAPKGAHGVVGRAADFSDEFVGYGVLDDPELEPGVGDFSLDAWIRVAGPQPVVGVPAAYTFQGPLVTLGLPHLPPTGFSFSVVDTDDDRARLQFSLDDGTPAGSTLYECGYVLERNEWYFVGVSVVRDVEVRIYVNGVRVGTCPIEPGSTIALGEQSPLTLGFALEFPDFSLGLYSYFNGFMDEVEYFGRALLDNEMMRLFVAGADGKCKVDCNGNGRLDANDIAKGWSDVDGNGVLDVCELPPIPPVLGGQSGGLKKPKSPRP